MGKQTWRGLRVYLPKYPTKITEKPLVPHFLYLFYNTFSSSLPRRKHSLALSLIISLLFNSPYTLFPFSSLPVTIFTEKTTESKGRERKRDRDRARDRERWGRDRGRKRKKHLSINEKLDNSVC